MAIRFQRPAPSTRASDASRMSGDGFAQWWAAIAIVAVAVMGVLTLGGGTQSPRPSSSDSDPARAILESLRTAERALAEIDQSFDRLCKEPVLVALELEPDCESGVITLGDQLFADGGGSQLKAAAKEDVSAAMTTYLERLRQLPAIWEGLEALEIRGHADPRALRNAYQTNLVGSQQRAVGVLLFLVGPEGVPIDHRGDLERLATVSGASYSRPPASCPEAVRECFSQWRRVEIRPVLSESHRREDWSRTLEGVRVTARRARDRLESETP
jgi:outer membrane protein OmpA-like peptidoglycan-associated protein